jgi:hypothetical protein
VGIQARADEGIVGQPERKNVSSSFSQADVIGFFVSFVLPLFVATVTKMTTHPRVQAILLLGTTVLATSLAELSKALTDHTPGFSYSHWALALLVSFVIAVAGHFGLWKPVGLSGKLLTAFTSPAEMVQVTIPTGSMSRTDIMAEAAAGWVRTAGKELYDWMHAEQENKSPDRPQPDPVATQPMPPVGSGRHEAADDAPPQAGSAADTVTGESAF